MPALLAPPITPPNEVDVALRQDGYAVLSASGLCHLMQIADTGPLDALKPYWNDLPADDYLRDGGRYRQRRHACLLVERGRIEPVARRPHWQSVEYNALHGGMQRWFAPIAAAMLADPAFERLLVLLAERAFALHGEQRWYVEVHPFRIDTTDGIGRPTPEGAHRDGVDLVAVLLVDRQSIRGGETRVFDAAGPRGLRFSMTEPWTTLLLDDARVIHESTPIQPEGAHGHRDTLVITLRAGGFQGDDQG